MISNTHLREELKYLETERENLANRFEKAMLKAQILQIKLLANMRTNQALALQGSGIDLIPRRIDNETATENE